MQRCEFCGGEFMPRNRVQVHCSRACGKKRWTRDNDHLRVRADRRQGLALRRAVVSPGCALLECRNGHEHIIGREQMHIADEACIFCRAPLEVQGVGWIERE